MSDPAGPARPAGGPPTVLAAVARPAIAGGAVLAVFFAIFFVWGGFVPISGGAVAPGRISPEGSRRTVQHLEGGIIRSLLVEDGDRVEQGDVLVLLQETQARAGVEVLRNQQRLLEAQRARLRSEQAGLDRPQYPQSLVALAKDDPDVADMLETQSELFAQRRALHQNQQAVFRQRIAQLEAEITGLEEQIESQGERVALVREEIAAVQELLDLGFAPKPRFLALQREEASIREQRAGNRADIARARQSIGEAEVQILAADAQRLDEISTELNEVQAALAEVNERMLASQDVLDRTAVRAPISGTVVNLRFRTQGGVLRPGDPILDIVPDDEALIIDAQISPLDVDLVSPGQKAVVHLSALAQRSLPRIEGEVIDVSADALFDEEAGKSYFRVRVRVDIEELAELGRATGEDVTLTAGMPAEVLVVTGERTMLEYLTAPLRDSLRRAMREG